MWKLAIDKSKEPGGDKYSYTTGTKGGKLAPLQHASPSKLTKVLRNLDKHPPADII